MESVGLANNDRKMPCLHGIALDDTQPAFGDFVAARPGARGSAAAAILLNDFNFVQILARDQEVVSELRHNNNTLCGHVHRGDVCIQVCKH